jgi:alkanesulfonate monooxygenase SsuD/methylene tetrahydromethanopterin reductase-like flavin-dependent oxidoreductase (luciferase family)
VANSYGEAREAAERGFARERRHFGEARRLYNPGGGPPQMGSGTSSVSENLPMSFIMGTPRQVAEEITAMEDAGVRNMMLKFNTGEMDTQQAQASMKLFGDKVLPLLRGR